MCGVGCCSGRVVWCWHFGVRWASRPLVVIGWVSVGRVRRGLVPPSPSSGRPGVVASAFRWSALSVCGAGLRSPPERKKERKGLGAPAGPRIRRVGPSAKFAPLGPWRKARHLSDVCRAGGFRPVRSGRAGIVRPCRPALFCRPAGLRLLPLSSAASAPLVMLCVVNLSAPWSGLSSVSAVGGSGAVVAAICCFGVVGLICVFFLSASLSAGSVLSVGGFAAAAAVVCCLSACFRSVGPALRGPSVGAVVGPFLCSCRRLVGCRCR